MRKENNSDSDVVPESNQIQELRRRRNVQFLIYEFGLARQKYDVWIAAVISETNGSAED